MDKTATEIKDDVLTLLKQLEESKTISEMNKLFAAGAITAAVDGMNKRLMV